MYCFDIETGGLESDSVIFSAAIVWFDETKQYTYEDLIESCCFVKFDVKEQVEKYNRKFEKDTLAWWKRQCKMVKDVSVVPYETDLSAEDGVNVLKDYIKTHSRGVEMVWTRGNLDQILIDSLCRASLKTDLLFKYSWYRDLRTGIDLLKETSKSGYCEVPNFDGNKVYKHNPIHDVAYDVMMLLYGI